MGTTIDKAIKHIEYLEKFSYVKQDRESFIIAIDTMCKYQKIKEIMAKRPKDMLSSNPTLRAISEVLEDGNDD